MEQERSKQNDVRSPVGGQQVDAELNLSSASLPSRPADRRRQKAEEVHAITDQALEQLQSELESGQCDTLKKFLNTVAQFHRYSFRNVMLIRMQRPGATRVAGFGTWKKLGRHVLKGEKGIRIFAPMVGKGRQSESPGTSDNPAKSPEDLEATTRRLWGFKVVTVFDVAQTDGEPLPGIGEVQGDPGTNLAHLHAAIKKQGITLGHEELGGADGVSRGGSIAIQSGLDEGKEFLVLAHEFAHELMHQDERRASTDRKQRELEAEAVGFVVCQAFGVDSSGHSADYIQLYKGDVDALRECLDVIRTTAAKIISLVEEVESSGS